MKILKLLTIFIGLAFTLASLEPVDAAVFDCPAGDVECLIDAINTANANSEADEINLEAGTYTLTTVDNMSDGPNGLPLITSQIIIKGTGAENSVIKRADSAPSLRIFNIPNSNGILTLEGLGISGGHTSEKGGGILNKGFTTIVKCTVSHNSADAGGGIFNSEGILNVRNSIIAENNTNEVGLCNRGGGIADGNFCGPELGGIVEITESTISKNTAGVSGGINFQHADEYGELIITNSTIDQNEAAGFGGGGIDGSGVLTVVNCTISRNHGAWDGAMNTDGVVTITNSTISENTGPNTGGIQSASGTTIVNTILGGNNGGSQNDCGGPIVSYGYNLIGDPNGCGIVLIPTDLTGEPGLAGFTDNGTPGNGRFPLLTSSQAIDSGSDDDCPPTDQLGYPRIDGDGDGEINCDIGAIEFQGANQPPMAIVDEEGPDISSVTANPNKLWPSNHKMMPVVIEVDAMDNYDSVCQIVLVESNESVNGLGDGDTAPDWVITGGLTVQLRAEGSGTGNGRIYTITVECEDPSGNSSTDTAKVTVPHDKGKKDIQNKKIKK